LRVPEQPGWYSKILPQEKEEEEEKGGGGGGGGGEIM
jgi:hypothetical protein